MKLSLFDYDLPEDLIAQYPLPDREKSQLMCLERSSQKVEHLRFFQIAERLKAGDLLLINDTKVIPARLAGKKWRSGGKVEVFLLTPKSDYVWEALIKPFDRIVAGTELEIQSKSGSMRIKIVKKGERGIAFVQLQYQGDLYQILECVGQVPLPPYIKRASEELDLKRYQTVYASKAGAVAAPTAGLHFTPELMRQLEFNGIEFARITLHVGLGTFLPVRAENIERHELFAEYYEISDEVAKKVNRHKEIGGRIIAVGTTSVRTLESMASSEKDGSNVVMPGRGMTSIFIYPGYKFKVVDGLITNFHLPKSTLLMLVSAFAGREFILRAYQEAINQRYRFYSYGDAMLIL